MSGVELIAAERNRQVTVEGWTSEHDDKHDAGQLVAAAAVYALEATFDGWAAKGQAFRRYWCFDDSWYKPKDRVRDLVKAGALIAAEIDRLQRAAATEETVTEVSPDELPDYLRDDAPYVICNQCGRKSWSKADFSDNPCGMTQPDGTKCQGRFGIPE